MSSRPAPAVEQRKPPSLILSALLLIVITLVPQGLWSALIALNLRLTPAVPWSVPLMIAVLYLLFLYLNGRWAPARSATFRNRSLRANRVARHVALWSGLSGGLAIVALVGLWMILASIVRMPGSVLPDLTAYPPITAVFAVLMGAAISPLCEQAGIWGYWESALLLRYKPRTAIIVSAAAFAILPHPPNHAALWAKFIFFFLTGLTFSTMSYLCQSILPGIALHFVALCLFFGYVWPQDATRRLLSQSTDEVFYVTACITALFGALSILAFRRLSRASRRNSRKDLDMGAL